MRTPSASTTAVVEASAALVRPAGRMRRMGPGGLAALIVLLAALALSIGPGVYMLSV